MASHQVHKRKARYYAHLITSISLFCQIYWNIHHLVTTPMLKKLKSSDPVVKTHQNYLLIQKVLHRHLWWNSCQSVRISISGPKTIETIKVNMPSLIKCIRKNCPILGVNWNGCALPRKATYYGVSSIRQFYFFMFRGSLQDPIPLCIIKTHFVREKSPTK